MPITKEDLESINGQQNLKKLKNQVNDRMRVFFTKYLTETTDETYQAHGLAPEILKKLQNSPFEESDVTERTMRRWIDGETTINRFAAYQICIAFEWGCGLLEEFFTYLGMDFVRFNDWREILYFYCIEKRKKLDETYKLYNKCIEIGLDGVTGAAKSGQPSITVLTSVIKGAYPSEIFASDDKNKSDYKFMEYMEEQKGNFHIIKNTRGKEIIRHINEIINEIKKIKKESGKQDTAPSVFASAFYEDDTKNSNFNYFANAITEIKKRRKNFSREFFILCLLINGKNSADEIEDILTSQSIGYPGLYPKNDLFDNLFDACVYEACAYYKRHENSNPDITAFDRFCKNTNFLEYKRPGQFAFDFD